MRALIRTLRRFLVRAEGQDILEYALLASALGFSALAAIGVLSTTMHNAYSAWDTAGQSKALVEMPDPK